MRGLIPDDGLRKTLAAEMPSVLNQVDVEGDPGWRSMS